jgi:DNA-binding NarL/FixJ family response regulator
MERACLIAVMLSASGEQRDVLDALKAGALGYLLKSAKPAELLDAVARTAAGDAMFTVGLAGLVLGEPALGRCTRPTRRHAPAHHT